MDLATIYHLATDLMRAVDFWVQTTIKGYIIEFIAESHQSFSKVDDVFRVGLRGKLLKEVTLWIKVLMVEEGLPIIQGPSMAA